MTTNLTKKHLSKFSKKRILKDYLDIQRNPLDTVVAEPLPDNSLFSFFSLILL